MYQIDVATAATALPTPAAPGTEGFFTDGNPASGLPATIVDADFMNMLMMELINLVEAGGQSPSKTTYNQVLSAIKVLGQQSAGNVGTDIGAANAYVVAFTPALTTPVPWVPFWFKVKTTNTGASTLNATGTVEALVGGAHLALQGGEMLAGGNALVYWNPTLNSGSGSYVLMFCSGAPDQVAAGTQSNHAAQVGQVQTGGLNYAVAAGTSDALTATLPAGVTALTDGFPLRLKLSTANTTTTPTINVTIGSTATGAFTIVKGADTALVAGDLAGAGAEAYFTYNASNSTWVLKNPATSGKLGNYAGAVPYTTGGATISSGDVGKVITLSGTTAYSLSLPLLSSVPAGSVLVFVNTNSGTVTLNRSGSDNIAVGGTTFTSITVPANESLVITSAANGWECISSDAALPLSPLFAASRNSSGYQKLPGGLIIQWGSTAAAANGADNAETLPLAFPNTFFSVTVSQNYTANSGSIGYGGALPSSLSTFVWRASVAGNAYSFVAIGW